MHSSPAETAGSMAPPDPRSALAENLTAPATISLIVAVIVASERSRSAVDSAAPCCESSPADNGAELAGCNFEISARGH